MHSVLGVRYLHFVGQARWSLSERLGYPVPTHTQNGEQLCSPVPIPGQHRAGTYSQGEIKWERTSTTTLVFTSEGQPSSCLHVLQAVFFPTGRKIKTVAELTHLPWEGSELCYPLVKYTKKGSFKDSMSTWHELLHITEFITILLTVLCCLNYVAYYFILYASNTMSGLCFYQKPDFSAARYHCCGTSYLYLHDSHWLFA